MNLVRFLIQPILKLLKWIPLTFQFSHFFCWTSHSSPLFQFEISKSNSQIYLNNLRTNKLLNSVTFFIRNQLFCMPYISSLELYQKLYGVHSKFKRSWQSILKFIWKRFIVFHLIRLTVKMVKRVIVRKRYSLRSCAVRNHHPTIIDAVWGYAWLLFAAHFQFHGIWQPDESTQSGTTCQ